MIEQGAADRDLITLIGRGLSTETPNGEFLQRPHAELLENAFQALEVAYKSGDFEAYERIEKKFVRQFAAFWKYRIQRYAATASTKQPGFLGRYLVTVGVHSEEMGVRQGLILGSSLEDANIVNVHIFRAEPSGDAWDVIDLEVFPFIKRERALYARLKLDTTIHIDGQVHPLPSKFHLELNGGQIAVFQKTTVQYYLDKEGTTRIYERTESVGHTRNK